MLSKIILFLLSLFVFFLLLWGTIEGSLATIISTIYSDPLNGLSSFFLVASVICSLIVSYKNKSIVPSNVLMLLFISTPILGYISYRIHIDVHGSFHGELLTFSFPIFIWTLGLLTLFIGILLAHLLLPQRKVTCLYAWDLKRASFLLFLFFGASLLSSTIALIRIGYIPVLHPNIDIVRGSFTDLAGRYVVKCSRLFLIASPLAAIMFFLSTYKKTSLTTFIICSIGLTIYGQRMLFIISIMLFCFLYIKIHKPRKYFYFLFTLLACSLYILLILAGEYRAGRVSNGMTVKRTMILPSVQQVWAEYSYVVNNIRQSEIYLKKDIYIGPLSLLLPRQIWEMFGVDKDSILKKYSAIYYFGKIFSVPLGIRISNIGEAYASYGIFYGVILQMLGYGIIFGVLEKTYLNLHSMDARVVVVIFVIILFFSLPVGTLTIIIDNIINFVIPLLLCLFIGAKRIVLNVKNASEFFLH